jgi:uncharacterized protein
LQRRLRRAIIAVRLARAASPEEAVSDRIEGVATSTTAFVGAAATGAPSGPVELASFGDYERAFGTANDELARAVRLFFENGGARAYAVRSPGPLAEALPALESVPFALLALPDAAALDADEAAAVAQAGAELCMRQRAFVLIDPPAALAPPEVQAWASGLETPDAALYASRLRLADGSETAASGAVAGVFARTDRDRGVWKAPAGASATVSGAVDVTPTLSDDAVDALALARINVVRRLPSRLVVWGARTLSSDPEWRYVSVRRLGLFIEKSIDEGTRWAAFEPNDEPLWNEVRRRVEEFLLGLFNQGAFEAARPETAYFVRCDRTTMTQDDIDNGRLVIVVGFAPRRPAEFVVLRIQ